MSKTKDYLIEEINKNPDKYKEFIDYYKFKEKVKNLQEKLNRCNDEITK